MLFIIDMQNDFVDQSGGKMAVRNADKLVPGILNRIKEYESKEDIIFYTLNIHDKMPDDNRSDSEQEWGQELFPILKKALQEHIPLKKSYYGIPQKTLRMIEEKYKDSVRFIEEIEIVGVETNICVLANAILIQNIFPDSKIIIDENLCTSNNLKLHLNSLKVMEGLNFEVRRS